MALLLHGVSGGWDEVLIAVVAFAVLWIAVKLAGRKPAADDEYAPAVAADGDGDQTDEHADPVPPPASKVG